MPFISFYAFFLYMFVFHVLILAQTFHLAFIIHLKIPLSSNFDLILSYLYPFLISDSIVFITNCCPSYLRLCFVYTFSRSFAINHLIYFHLVQNLIQTIACCTTSIEYPFELDFEVPFDVF